MDRVTILKDWMQREGRKAKWVAEQVECSDTWMSYILNRHKPLSDKLARKLQETLGVPFDDLPRAPQATKRRRAAAKPAKSSAAGCP
jgi:hypothetical protein